MWTIHGEKWDMWHMGLAHYISTASKDPSTKVGSIIVDHDRHIVATGYNGFPRFIDDNKERYLDRHEKYPRVVHAELNAILNAIAPLRYTTLYTTLFPCNECMKAIIQSHISSVVYPIYIPRHMEESMNWKRSMEISRDMANEADIEMLAIPYNNV